MLSFTPRGLVAGLVVSLICGLALIVHATLLHGARRRRIEARA